MARKEKVGFFKLLFTLLLPAVIVSAMIGYVAAIPSQKRVARYASFQRMMQPKNICTDRGFVGKQYYPGTYHGERACFEILPWYSQENFRRSFVDMNDSIIAVFSGEDLAVDGEGAGSPSAGPVGGNK